MSGGFGAIPDELRQTAGRIVDAIGGAEGMPWRGPSGDYGHAGVQAGWAQFIDDIKAEVKKLQEQGHTHGDDLKAAAVKYLESDETAGGQLGGLGELIDALPAAGGAAGGGIAGALAGHGDGGGVGSAMAARLAPEETGEAGGPKQ
jgi:hypothetical protein